MENLLNQLNATGETLYTSDMARLGQTPRAGIYEDLGTSFKTSHAKISERMKSVPRQSSPVSDIESGSEDEMDCLSQKTRADEKEVVTEGKVATIERLPDYHPSTLERKSTAIRGLKFTKYKPETEKTPPLVYPRPPSRNSRLRTNGEDGQYGGKNETPSRKPMNSVLRPRPRRKSRPPPPASKREAAVQLQLPPEEIDTPCEHKVGKPKLSTMPLPSPLSFQKSARGRNSRRDSPDSTISLNQSSSSTSEVSPPPLSRPSRSTSASTPASRLPQGFPTFSPLGSPAATPNVTTAKGFPLPSPLVSGRKASKGGGKVKRKIASRDPQPFPMSTQDFGGIDVGAAGSPDTDDSDSGYLSRKRKYKRGELPSTLDRMDPYEEEDSLFMSPAIDPSTLCPYCDALLPDSPTPLLRRLLETTAGKSHSDPRPTNPLGRKAPLAIFISVCRRHQFESQVLPEAEAKGWPKAIDWERLSGRMERMKADLRDIINDPDSTNVDEPLGSTSGIARGPRIQCVFWREAITAIKLHGLRGVAGVRGQFLDFDKTQPGYYGELGSVIIQHTLLSMFPPESLEPTLFLPLTANEFIQRILVPEVALRLIMEDRQLKGPEGKEAALQVLRDSASYGVAMFSEDGWEGQKSTQVWVGDRIVMERARKRRQEIEEETGVLIGDLQQSETDGEIGKSRRYGPRRVRGTEILDSDRHEKQPQSPRNFSRKKGTCKDEPAPVDPRPDDNGMASSIRTMESLAQSRPRRAAKVVDYTDISSDDDKPPFRDRLRTKRSAKIPSRSPSMSTLPSFQPGSKQKPISLSDMDICSSDSGSNVVVCRQKDMSPRKPKPKFAKNKDRQDNGIIIDVITPVAKRRTRGVGEENTDSTPRPPRKADCLQPQGSILTRARERTKLQNARSPQKGRTKPQLTSKDDSTIWLPNMRAAVLEDSSDFDEAEKCPVAKPVKRDKGSFSWLLSEPSSQEGPPGKKDEYKGP